MAVTEILVVGAAIVAAAVFVAFTPDAAQTLLTIREWAFRIGALLLAILLLATNHVGAAALIIFFGAVWFFVYRPDRDRERDHL